MRYPEYEDLLAESRSPLPGDHANAQQESLVDDPDLEAFLTESRARERNRIETELEQIDRRLQKRTVIHDETIADLDDAIQDETDRLHRMQRPFAPKDRVADQEQRIRDLEQQRQDARRAHWRDREQLQRERRRLHRELAELRDTDLSAVL